MWQSQSVWKRLRGPERRYLRTKRNCKGSAGLQDMTRPTAKRLVARVELCSMANPNGTGQKCRWRSPRGTRCGHGGPDRLPLPWKSLSLRARASNTFFSSSASLKGPSSSSGQLQGEGAGGQQRFTGRWPRRWALRALLAEAAAQSVSSCGQLSLLMAREKHEGEEEGSHGHLFCPQVSTRHQP